MLKPARVSDSRYFLRGDHDGALAEHERALAISPNLASAHGERGSALVFFGATKGGAQQPNLITLTMLTPDFQLG